jgi:hypothetical protein
MSNVNGFPTVIHEYPFVYGTVQVDPLQGEVQFRVKVSDQLVREQLQGFDGLERPFVRIPWRSPDGGVDYYEWSLPNWHSEPYGKTGNITLDVHTLRLPLDRVDLNTLYAEGVEMFMETNQGTVWVHEPGEKVKPDDWFQKTIANE